MTSGDPDDRPTRASDSVGDAPFDSSVDGATMGEGDALAAGGLPRDPAIGDYTILEKIGSGGMGHVFKARHRRMERIVALKVLPASAMRNANAVERFHREVRAAAQLFHANIVTAFDAGEQGGIHYLVMEYVDGQPFGVLVRERGPLPVEEAVGYIIQAARGLQYAHSREVVHRDIKPSNLMLDAQGVVKILDMGMARFRGSVTHVDETAPDGLTETGVIIGTVDFMSPEQAKNAKTVDHRTDIYSLGCTLYYLLTGQPVFSGDLVQTLLAHAANAAPSLRELRPDAPEQLDRVYQKMLAKTPEGRYSTMDEVISALESCQAGLSSPSDAGEGRLTRITSALMETSGGAAEKAPSTVSKILAVGINLGTSFSSIAYLDDEEHPVTIPLASGKTRMPSVVLIDGSTIVVGEEAVKALGAKGDHIAQRIKRRIGRPPPDSRLGANAYPSEVLLALILKRLADDARARIGHFERVVISVPAYFDEVRRKAVQDAGAIAGLTVIDIVNEPTAAALSFSFREGFLDGDGDSPEPQKLLVLDLGGGTFDSTVLECNGARVTALATDGDGRFGGCDWDDRLVKLMAEQFAAEHGVDPREDASATARLRYACEAARCSLSTSSRATITYQYQGRSSRFRLTREQLEELSRDLLDRMRRIIRRTLKAAGLGWDGVDQVLLIGGLSRMPAIRRMLREISGIHPDTSALEDETVAHGAALQAANQLAEMEGESPPCQVGEINSQSLGVVGVDRRSGQKCNAVLIPRNTPLPAAVKRTFKTKKDDRGSLQVRIVQGEDPSPDKCTRIGKCVLEKPPAGLAPGSPVTVEFQHGRDGRLTVFLETPDKRHRAAQEIVRTSGLSEEHIERWRQWVDTMMLCSNV